VRAALRAVTQGAELKLPEALLHKARLFGHLYDSDDKREGVAAFLQKKHPTV
jgi:enoyl-CoA hydratase/carnithine racemase